MSRRSGTFSGTKLVVPPSHVSGRARDARSYYAAKRPNPLQYLLKEFRTPRELAILASRENHAHGQDAIGLESGVQPA